MNFHTKKPGVILFPVSAVIIIFAVLLILLIDQKQEHNSLLLEYRVSRLINVLLDLHIQGEQIQPESIDENIIGFGVYNSDGSASYRYGTAPSLMSEGGYPGGETLIKKKRSIIVIRSLDGDRKIQPERMMMPRLPGSVQRQFRDLRDGDPLPPRMMSMMQKYQAGVFLEYSNSSYLSQRRLVILLVVLFLSLFLFFSFMIFSLYKSNKRLVIKSEHDKQLIQLGEAARTLAHEIRNPLGTLKIQRDILKKKLPDGLSESLDVIDRELKRLNMLVDRVGEFLKNPQGDPVEIELCGYLDGLYSGRDNLRISGCNSDYLIEFDRDRLRTVIDNVVNNAIENGGFADIVLENESDRVIMVVKDLGKGFTEEALKRAYDPFFTTRDRGTGLGLSVVKKLIDSAGGRVEITNLKESGACVRLEFPRRNR